jgi:hypothetical protein
MERKIMGNIAERLTHYQTKCCQHLNRVRLSHILALKALQNEQTLSEGKYKDLVSASFADVEPDKNLARMRMVLHSQHLLSLKINFELFLNRLLSTIWAFHFAELAPTISGDVSLSELASSIQGVGESSADLREFIIDKVVGIQGLERFEKALKRATQILLRDVLYAKNLQYWPQIYTAFAARHLVEHRDGKIDRRFRESVAQVWSNSSWGRRLGLEGLEKVVVEEEDVIAAHDAMLNAAEILTNKTLRWSSRNKTTPFQISEFNNPTGKK